jgi:hypothetical protein
MGLGSANLISLAEARDKAHAARKIRHAGTKSDAAAGSADRLGGLIAGLRKRLQFRQILTWPGELGRNEPRKRSVSPRPTGLDGLRGRTFDDPRHAQT